MPVNNGQKPPDKCPLCGSDVMEFKGVSLKTGRPYHFWGCSNPDCRWVWRKPSQAEIRHKEIMNALRVLYKEMRSLKEMFQKYEQNRKESIPTTEKEALSGGETSEGEMA